MKNILILIINLANLYRKQNLNWYGKKTKLETLILFLYVILLVIFSGLGQLIGAASIKFGKVGAFLIAMFVLIIIITGIVAIALVGEFNVEISINGFSLLYKFIAVFVAVIVYLCGAYINYLVLKNYEVRA